MGNYLYNRPTFNGKASTDAPLSSIPDSRHTCSTNPSHHRSSPTHWTSTGLPPRTSHRPAFCFSFFVIFLVDACVGLNWLSAVFLSHVNQIASFIHLYNVVEPIRHDQDYDDHCCQLTETGYPLKKLPYWITPVFPHPTGIRWEYSWTLTVSHVVTTESPSDIFGKPLEQHRNPMG